MIYKSQGFGREKDGHRGKLIGSNLVRIFVIKNFKNSRCANLPANWKSLSEPIVYSEPIKSGNVKINFS